MQRQAMGATRRHVWIDDEDWEYIQSIYGPGTQLKGGASKAVRSILSAAVKRHKEMINRRISEGTARGDHP